MSMKKVPPELLINIVLAGSLDVRDILNLALSCKHLSGHICSENGIFLDVIKRYILEKVKR
jgi:hypothetical protein